MYKTVQFNLPGHKETYLSLGVKAQTILLLLNTGLISAIIRINRGVNIWLKRFVTTNIIMKPAIINIFEKGCTF